jgi:hypothetical protein
MTNFLGWLKRKGKQETPTIVGVLILLILLVDLALILDLGKLHSYRFSKTWEEYILWVGTVISFVTGYIFWPLSIAVVVLRAFLTKKKLGGFEAKAILGPLFDKIAAALGKLAVALPILGIECVSSFGLMYWIILASTFPAPPRPGQLVISNYPGSQAYFLAIGPGVGLYARGQPGNTPSFPVEFLQIPGVLPPQGANLNWRGIESIVVSFDESRIYAVDSQNGLVHFISTRPRLNEIKEAYVGKSAKSIAMSADGKKLFVAVEQPCPPGGDIHVFDTDTLRELASIGNVSCPEELFSATTKPLLFVASQGGLNNDPLYVIDTREDKVIKAIPGFATGFHVLATHDGGTVYVPTDEGLKIVRNWRDTTPDIKTIPESGISAMALTLDESTLIVGTTIAGQPELLSFDARTGARCKNKPFELEATPATIAVASDGALMIPMPRRIAEGDSRALECGGH